MTGPGTTTASLPQAFPGPFQVTQAGPGQPGGPGGPGGTSPPSLNAGYEIRVLAAPDYSTVLCVLPRYMSLQFTKMLNDKGSGSVVCNLDDPFWQDATVALQPPAAPYVIAQGSSDADASEFTAPVEIYSPQASAITVLTSASGTNPAIAASDTQSNLYFCVPAGALSSNPYFAAGSTTGWTGFQSTIASAALPGPAGLAATGALASASALAGSPFPWGCEITFNGTANGALEGSPAPFAIATNTAYLVVSLAWSSAAITAELGCDWENSGHTYVSTSTNAVTIPAQQWTAVSTVVTSPSSGVSYAYPRIGLASPAAGQQLFVTALAVLPAAGPKIFQCLDASALGLTDAVSVTYNAAAAQQTNVIVLTSSSVQAQGALDVAVQATGTSATAAVSGTPAQPGELGLLFVNDAAAGGTPSNPSGWTKLTEIAGTSRGLSQKMLIPLYSYPPTSFWTDVINSAPATGIIVANVDSGPGGGQEPNFQAVFQEAAAAGITLVGYIATGYGAASQVSLQNQVQQWKDYYGITSILFDEVSTAADYVAYYQSLVDYVHEQDDGGESVVVLNCGAIPAQSLFGVIGTNDIINVCEDSYANFAADGAAAPAWLFDLPSSQIGITVNQCATSGNMSTALGISSADFNAGWVWVTSDAIYNVEPSYFAAEVSALASTGTTEQFTTAWWREVTSTAALSPSASITSAAWTAQMVTLAGSTSAAASTLWDGEHLWQVLKDGVVVFEFFAETITEQLVDQSEQRSVTTTGPGTIAALGWASAMPPGFPDIVFKTDALQDGFAEIDENGNLVVDTSLWNVISPTDMVTLNPSGTLQLTASADTTYCGASPYDLTESLVSVQITPLGQGTQNSSDPTVALDGSQVTQFYVQSNANAGDYLLMGVTASGFYCQLGDTGLVGTSTGSPGGPIAFGSGAPGVATKGLGAYNPASQLYWQISAQYLDADSGAVQATFWVSADGQTYSPVWQVEPTWTPDNLTVFFACSYDQPDAAVMSVTNLNGNVVTPSSSGNIYFGEPIMAVWYSIFQQAQSRGTIPFVTTLLNGETDSFGNPWSDSNSVQIQNGTDLYSLLQSHTAIVDADYIMQPGFVLQVGLPEPGQISLGVDRSMDVIFREGQWTQQKQYTRDRSQIANLDGAVNSDGTTISASDEESILQWGQREGWVQTAVQVNPASMEIAAQASVLQTADEVESYTITVAPGQAGYRPFRDFNVGDWVGLEAPGPLPGGPDFSANTVSAVRVTAIAISVDATGLDTVELTLQTYLQWLQEQLQYLVNKMGGQFINSLGTTPVTSSANGVPTQLPTVFAPNINGLNSGISEATTGIPSGAQLVYNALSGQWQAAATADLETGSVINPTGSNLQTMHYSTDSPSPGTLIASISPTAGTDITGQNVYLPGIVSYGTESSQTIQLYMGTVTVGSSPGTQIVLNPNADQVFNLTQAISGTMQAVSEFTTNDIAEVLPGLAGSVVLSESGVEKMALALCSPLNANSAACVILETENDSGTDTPAVTFGQVSSPDGSSLVFVPTATLTPWSFLVYGESSGTTVTTLTGSGNWSVPSTVSQVKCEVFAPCGAGGGSNHAWWTVQAAGGGGGGEYACEPALAVTPSGTCAYNAQTGGAFAGGSNGGAASGNATFAGASVTVTAHPGLPGASSFNGGGGGLGGSSSTNTIHHNGGDGADGGSNDGGGGGGAAGPGGTGGAGAITGGGTGASGGGGSGGQGAASNGSGEGGNGNGPGGGGGGGCGVSAAITTHGGNGSPGSIRLTYTTGEPPIMFSASAAAGTDQYGTAFSEGIHFTDVVDGNTYSIGTVRQKSTATTNIASTSAANLSGISIPVGAGTYTYRAWVPFTGNSTNDAYVVLGLVTGSGTVAGTVTYINNGVTKAQTALSNSGLNSAALVNGQTYIAALEGTVTITVAGDLVVSLAASANSSTFTLITGSFLEIKKQ